MCRFVFVLFVFLSAYFGASTFGTLSVKSVKALLYGGWKRLEFKCGYSYVFKDCSNFCRDLCIVEGTSEMKCMPRCSC